MPIHTLGQEVAELPRGLIPFFTPSEKTAAGPRHSVGPEAHPPPPLAAADIRQNYVRSRIRVMRTELRAMER
jgi:hypothetical protein